jgi:hypothetical protein
MRARVRMSGKPNHHRPPTTGQRPLSLSKGRPQNFTTHSRLTAVSTMLTIPNFVTCHFKIMPLTLQVAWLFILALPIACIAWTVTHEEVFREPREFFGTKAKYGRTIAVRKFFYLLTCEYCFSHYVVILFLVITRYKLLYEDWRGYLIGGFALVWIANFYMILFGRLRVTTKKDKMDADLEELKLKEEKKKVEKSKHQ